MKQVCVLPEFTVAAARYGTDFASEQAELFPGGEVAAAAGLVPVHDVGKATLRPAARGPGHLLGEDAAPAGTVTVSLAALVNHLVTWAMLCQYSRAEDAAVPVSQYRVMLSSTWSAVRTWPRSPG
jgi:hypothetical protein